ncbi:hypothetical protein SAMN04489712_1046 [Thermomonospora echinospora]|uniref:Uncharacterized protein n=2 Tax=Thermomonospora echinospora TaxID=1992 RepID=A0A1H5YIT9_9ACTN|nr:hypothetical protein SAMN04489712_1046 [Thermomonospora echinospora]
MDRGTQRWVRLTGRRVDPADEEWLSGPRGDRDRVGDSWLHREAARHGARVLDEERPAGLVASMALLDGPGFDSSALHPRVRDFYERTARWRLELWSQWSPWAWPFGWLISTLFARRLQQLSLPLRPLDVAHGMSSEITPVADADGRVIGTSWRRRLRANGETVFSGWYQDITLPGVRQPRVRVVFPLPNGRLVVLLRPEVTAKGGLVLASPEGGWGEDGAYLVVDPGDGSPAWARRIPVHERFHVYVDTEGVLRTDHALTLWSIPALRLHYRLDETDAPD